MQIEAQISTGDEAAMAKDLIKEIGKAENEYQVWIVPVCAESRTDLVMYSEPLAADRHCREL